MTTHTFGTLTDPAHYVEIVDPTDSTQVIRPPAGTALRVRDYDTQTELTGITTLDKGYWSYTADDVPGIEVSGDGGSTWVGPLWSKESQASANSTGSALLAQVTALTERNITTDGTWLTGGGDLTADRLIQPTTDAVTALTAAGTALQPGASLDSIADSATRLAMTASQAASLGNLKRAYGATLTTFWTMPNNNTTLADVSNGGSNALSIANVPAGVWDVTLTICAWVTGSGTGGPDIVVKLISPSGTVGSLVPGGPSQSATATIGSGFNGSWTGTANDTDYTSGWPFGGLADAASPSITGIRVSGTIITNQAGTIKVQSAQRLAVNVASPSQYGIYPGAALRLSESV